MKEKLFEVTRVKLNELNFSGLKPDFYILLISCLCQTSAKFGLMNVKLAQQIIGDDLFNFSTRGRITSSYAIDRLFRY